MSSLYSNSSITGYKDNLPLQSVRLPLKYLPKAELKSANDEFNSKLSSTGGVINIGDKFSTYVDYITYEVLNDLKTICLTPVNLKLNKLNFRFQRLEIVLPHSIISNNCFSIYLKHEQADSLDDPILVVDMIDENYLFITLRFQLADFIQGNKDNLKIDNFHNWGHISVPYSFELRSQPFLLKAVDDRNLVVSLKDGGLLHFQRFDILEDFDVYNFSNTSTLLSMNLFSGLFKRDKPKTEVILDGISSRSLVDLLVIDHFLFTLSVSKIIQIWDLNTHQYAIEPIDLNADDQDSPSLWLTSVPTKYLQFIRSDTGKNYLALHTTFNSQNENEKNGFSGVKFAIWEFISEASQSRLIPVDQLSYFPTLPDIQNNISLKSSNEKYLNLLWYIQDFEILLYASVLTLNILWKSNTSSVLDTYSLNFDSGSVLSNTKGQLDIEPLISELSLYYDDDYYSNKILNSGRYNFLVISTSLNILREYVGISPYNTDKAFNESVLETIRSTSKISQQDERLSWLKLDALCEELKRSGEEALAFVSIDEKSILTLQNNGIGLVRPSHYYETFLNSSTSTIDGKLASILRSLSITLSGKTFNKIYQRLTTESQLSSEICTELYDSYIRDKFSDKEIQDIITELGSIPDVISLINSLVEGIDTLPSPDKFDSDQIDTYLKLITIETFKNIKAKHESILLSLIVLFLICEANSELLSIANKIIGKLSSYQIVDGIFDICFNPNEVQVKGEVFCGNLEYSLFAEKILKEDHKLGDLVKSYKLNTAFDYFYVNILSSYDKIVIDTCIELLNQGLVKNKFFNKLTLSRDMDRFLIGLMYLENDEPFKFLEIFEDYSNLSIEKNSQLIERLLTSMTKNSKVSKFLKSIAVVESNEFLRKAYYYHALAELSLTQSKLQVKYDDIYISKLTLFPWKGSSGDNIQIEFLESSLRFENKAIENLRSIISKSEEIKETLNSYYLNTFEMALSLDKYDIVYDSLSFIVGSISSQKRKELFRKLISHLISKKSLSIIFLSKSKVLRDNYVLIDSLLLDMANNELTLSNSLIFYENLYSWRLFGASETVDSNCLADKRGAIEALYMFITRFKCEHSNLIVSNVESFEDIKQYKLKILELYLIILNCLKSIESEDDKWIIKFQDNQSLSILNLSEISIEYFEWLKELENDLN